MFLRLLILSAVLSHAAAAVAQQPKLTFEESVRTCMSRIAEINGKFTPPARGLGLGYYTATKADDQVMINRFQIACLTAYQSLAIAEKSAAKSQ